ncbi:S-layer homology domain-containing protein [Thermotalea metallivorans]|uniref:Endoglucanase n=1 Tax=Thermotalea metallivorans TaxID=520762 RepID=A0A140L6P5_9FIRM|nr:S-layer homology domain-containing protein [Thermotalea metallivorans]KXG76220.1 Endoglucanase [Thermotalea metallivorans]
MKKIILCFMIGLLSVAPIVGWAAPPEFSGGVNNEYAYEEIVFITGKPVKFVGTLALSEREKENTKTITYRFNKLTPEDKTIEAELTKSVTFVTEYTNRNEKGQTIAQTRVEKYSESLKIGQDKYELKDFQFSKSDVIDNRPAAAFYSGNLKGRKYYVINKDQGEVVVDISGGSVGYENFWGNTETQIIDYVIQTTRLLPSDGNNGQQANEKTSWQGTVRVQTSDSQTKTLKYAENEANFSSFYGGHIRITNREMVSRYDYNLPQIAENKADGSKRNKGSMALSKQMVPKLERLIVPKFRDIGGHWAQESIEKLYSLDVFDEQSSFFAPNIPFTRGEFIKGVIRACDIRPNLDASLKPSRSRKQPPEESPFQDVKVEDKHYQYIKSGLEKQIISGVSPDRFDPEGPLTRAQAITILIRALGFENKGPSPGYYTSFADDRDIPNWARDSIYVAKEIHLIQGDDFNRVNPNKVVSRAEASAMLVRFLEFLEKDLQRDYRENIIQFQ